MDARKGTKNCRNYLNVRCTGQAACSRVRGIIAIDKPTKFPFGARRSLIVEIRREKHVNEAATISIDFDDTV